MGGFSTFVGFDDGATGDGYGYGLTDSAVGYVDETTDPAPGTATPGQSLAGEQTDLGVGDFDLFGGLGDHLDLSQNTESAPSGSIDLGISENGSGSAAPSANTKTVSGADWNQAIGALGKFGAGIAGIITGHSVAMTPGGVPIGAAGSRVLSAKQTHISGIHLLAIVAIGGILLVMLFSGSRGAQA